MSNLKDQTMKSTLQSSPEKNDMLTSSKITDFLSLIKEEDKKELTNQIASSSDKNGVFRVTKKALKTTEIMKLSRLRRQQEIGIPVLNQASRLVYIKDIEAMKSASPQYRNIPYNGITEFLHKSTKIKGSTFNLGFNINKFRENMKKYRPTVLQPINKIEKQENTDEIDSPLPEDNNNNPSAFLTYVNLPEPEKIISPQPLIEEDEKNPGEIDEQDQDHDEDEDNDIIETKEDKMKKWNHFNIYEPRSLKGSISMANNRHIAMPSYKKRVSNRRLPTSSIENFERLKKLKPKLYISFKSNSIQGKGKPNSTEHLMKVFNGEGTPFLPMKLINNFGSKKDLRKMTFDAYLAQYDPKALKYENDVAFNEYYYDDDKL